MGGAIEDVLLGVLGEDKLTPELQSCLESADLACLVCHLAMSRRRLPQETLQDVAELLAPRLNQEYAAVLRSAAARPYEPLGAPKELRTVLLTLGTRGAGAALQGDYFSPKVGGRLTLAEALQRDMHTWGQADVYLDFVRNGQGALRLGAVPRPYRSFTVTMWFSIDEHVGRGAEPVALFRFVSSRRDSGVEATLEYWGDDVWQLVYRTYTSAGGSDAAQVNVIRESISFTRGRWQMLAVSHSMPYLSLIKRSQVRVALDSHVLTVQDLPFPSPPGGAQGADADTWKQCVVGENLVGRLAGVTLYADVLSEEALQLLYRAGPNLPHLSHPVAVPTGLVDDAVTPLGSELYRGRPAEVAAVVPISFCIHAQWTMSQGLPEGWVLVPLVDSSRLEYYSVVPPVYSKARGAPPAPTTVTVTGSVSLHRSNWTLSSMQSVGGVGAILSIMSDTAESAVEPSYLTTLLHLLAAVLERHPAHREAFLQTYGFHVVAKLLSQKAATVGAASQCLNVRTVDACMAVLDACGGERAGQLFWAAIQGLLLNWDLWCRATFDTQMYLLERVIAVASRNVPAFRRCMGVQALLDLLRLHVCGGGEALAAQQQQQSAAHDPAQQPGQTTALRKVNSGRSTGGLDRADQARVVEMCEPLLAAIAEQGFVERRADEAKYADSMNSMESVRSDVLPLVRCLQETRSSLVQMAVLRVLTSIRSAHEELLWRDLVRMGFDRTAAWSLLTRKGTQEDVRRLTMELFVWVVELAAQDAPRLATYMRLSRMAKPRAGNMSPVPAYQAYDDSSPGANSREEELAAFLENYRQLTGMAGWVATSVRMAVEAGAWGSKVTAETVETLTGREEKEWPLWLVLPLLAAILPLAPPAMQQNGLTTINMKLKVDERSRQEVLAAGYGFWVQPLLALASVGARVKDTLPLVSPASPRASRASAGSAGDDWEDVTAFGEGAVTASAEEAASITEELALDALATLTYDEMLMREDQREAMSRARHADAHGLWPRVVDELNRISNRIGGDKNWPRVSLARVCTMVLERIARSGVLFSSPTMKAVIKILAIVEERVFPLTFASAQATPPVPPGTTPDFLSGPTELEPGYGWMDTPRQTLTPYESRLVMVILEVVRLLRTGSGSGSGGDRDSGKGSRAPDSSTLPALLTATRVLMGTLSRLNKLPQSQGAVEELCGIIYLISSSRSLDGGVAKESMLLLLASLRDAIRVLSTCAAREDDDIRQTLSSFVIFLVNEYGVGLDSSGRLSSDMSHSGSAQTPARRAFAEVLAPATNDTTVDAVLNRLGANINAEIEAYRSESESLVPNIVDDEELRQLRTGLLLQLPGLTVETTSEHQELSRELTAQNRAAVEAERARLIERWNMYAEERQEVTEFWDKQLKALRLEALDLQSAADVQWALDTEQGLVPFHRRVLLTPMLQSVERSVKAPLTMTQSLTMTGSRMMERSLSVEGEEVGKALALQLGKSIKDVTALDPADLNAGDWSVVDGEVHEEHKAAEGGGGGVAGDGQQGAGPLIEEVGIPDVPPEDDDEADNALGAAAGEGAASPTRNARAEKRLSAPRTVYMGIRTQHDRSVADAEVVREDDVTLVTPRRVFKGTLVLTRGFVYFFRNPAQPAAPAPSAVSSGAAAPSPAHGSMKDGDPAENDDEAAVERFGRHRWVLANVAGIYLRRYRLRDTALEVYFRRGRGRSLFVDFGRKKVDTSRRDRFTSRMMTFVPQSAWKQWPKMAPDQLLRRHSVTQAWLRREISNFDYLMSLNIIGGRSFNDLCQYPVFPWVLSNYTSPTINLADPANFRDLKKPMGALNEDRLQEFMERYEAFQDPVIPRFMYGSHYSTAAGVVLHYLVRLEPFVSLHKEMQGSDFDVADRLFGSVPRAWRMNTSDLSEVKELTPEWYSMPDFLRNVNNLDMGETQDGRKVGDVELPPWAPTAEDFIRVQREALESEYVSQNLHHWIDLIFGYKQRGPAAVEARNVFFYLTYYGAVDVSAIEDDALRMATEMQINHFGQCPVQLFSRPHPPRDPCLTIYRPLRSLLRQAINLPTDIVSPSQRPAWPLAEPVIVQEADNRLLHVKILHDRIITVNDHGVVSSYMWACSLRSADPRERPLSLPSGDQTTQIHPPLPTNECLTPTSTYFVDPKLADTPRPPTSPTALERSRALSAAVQKVPGVTGGRPSSQSTAVRPDLTPNSTTTQKIQVLKLTMERDRTPLEHVPRVSPPPLGPLAPRADGGGRRAATAFPIHITRTGRFILSAGNPFGAIHMVEMDVDAGCVVTGEAVLMGHSAAVTCITSAGLEELGYGYETLLTGSDDCTAMLWRIQRLHATRKKPCVTKRPDRVLLGHSTPVTSCALSYPLGITVTASSNEILVHSVEDVLLIRRVPMPSSLSARGYCFDHCLVSHEGYIVSSMVNTATSAASAAAVSRIQVWTANGNIVAERDVPASIVRLALLGRGSNVVMAARAEGMVEFFDLMELDVVGSYKLVPNAQGQAPTLACIDAGPHAATPIMIACGTQFGALVVAGLPLMHMFKDLETAEGFAAALMNVPARLVKDSINLALNTFGKAAGIASTAKGVAIEALGEAKSLVKEVKRQGLKGLVGYWTKGGSSNI